jgi:hypothetical protein
MQFLQERGLQVSTSHVSLTSDSSIAKCVNSSPHLTACASAPARGSCSRPQLTKHSTQHMYTLSHAAANTDMRVILTWQQLRHVLACRAACPVLRCADLCHAFQKPACVKRPTWNDQEPQGVLHFYSRGVGPPIVVPALPGHNSVSHLRATAGVAASRQQPPRLQNVSAKLLTTPDPLLTPTCCPLGRCCRRVQLWLIWKRASSTTC